MAGIVQMAPWGGSVGTAFDMGTTTQLSRIQIRQGDCIFAIRFQYENAGALQWSKRWGGSGGVLQEVVLEDDEFLMCVLGHTAKNVIKSLTFISNKRQHGPYGTQDGTVFCLPQVGNNKIIGFHGKASALIDSIGVYLGPIASDEYSKPSIVSMGPWGSTTGGFPKDTGIVTRFTRIQIYHKETINYLRFQYERAGKIEWSEEWGNKTNGNLSEIVLDDDESLGFLLGHTGIFRGTNVVRSLTLISNTRTHGPYGTETGTLFCLPQVGNIVGFQGRTGTLIDALGVHWGPAKPLITVRETIKYGASAIQSNAGDVQYHWIKSSNDHTSVGAPADPSNPGALVDVWDFQTDNRLMDISAKYKLPSIAVGTKYQIVVIVLLKDGATGWRLPLNVKLPDGRQTTIQIPDNFPKNSWETLVIGDFIVAKDGDAEFKIYDTNSGQLKDGFFLRGFELRPL